MSIKIETLDILAQLQPDDPMFAQVGELLGVDEDAPLDPVISEITDHLNEILGPIFDSAPREIAMTSCFLFGLLAGQKMAAAGHAL